MAYGSGLQKPAIRQRRVYGGAPIDGYTGLMGYALDDSGLGFNPFKAVGKAVKGVAKGVAKGAKFVVKHPLTVAAPVAAVGLTAAGVPVLPAVAKGVKAAGKGVTSLFHRKPQPAQPPGTFIAKPPAADIRPSVIAEPEVQPNYYGQRHPPALQAAIEAAKSVTGPTWTDELRQQIQTVGKGALQQVKQRAIRTILAQPGVQRVAGRVAKEAALAEVEEAKVAIPPWLLPLGIGVGALLLMQRRGR